MGCASSNPLITGGKNLFENAKESASEVLNKGEQTMHDVGETAKDGIVTGMESVKGAVETVVHTAENSIGGVVNKISDKFTNAKTTTEDTLNQAQEAAVNNTMEAVSEAETVLASEMENGKDALISMSSTAQEKIDSFGEAVKDVKEPMVDLLEIEDIEQTMEIIDNNIGDMNEVNAAVAPIEIPLKDPAKEGENAGGEEKMDDKPEEPAPTLWEIAADLIVDKKETAIKLMTIPIDEILLHKEMVSSELTPEILEEKLAEQFLSTSESSSDILAADEATSQDTLLDTENLENDNEIWTNKNGLKTIQKEVEKAT